MSKTSEILKRVAAKRQKRAEPVWSGPESDAPNGGITYSMLSRFLVCRERFRLMVVEGLKPADAFNARMEFGNMWHVCEENHAKVVEEQKQTGEVKVGYLPPLRDYCAQLGRKYPLQREQIQHWFDVTQALFPVYAHHWSRHPDVKDRTPLLQEQVFHVPYKLPSGRTVWLRGKWDAVDLIGKGKAAGVYIQENKTKSSIDGQKIARQLSFDLQTMLYLTALESWPRHFADKPILGVRYNVIRRSAHKSVESMMKKVHEDRDAGRIGEWFARWNVPITPADVAKFRQQCLDPILEQLCDWWQFWLGNEMYKNRNLHWRHPFGVWNVLDEGGSSDLDAYLESGSEAGLQRTDQLFPELQ